MALGSNQPLTEMSTRNLPAVKGWPARKTDNLTDICEPIVYKMWEPRRLTTLWASTACYRDSFTFLPVFWTYAVSYLRVTGVLCAKYSAEIKNAWRYTSTSSYNFIVWCLIKHRDNFTFIHVIRNDRVASGCI
jgi:hypothetical protein